MFRALSPILRVRESFLQDVGDVAAIRAPKRGTENCILVSSWLVLCVDQRRNERIPTGESVGTGVNQHAVAFDEG